MASGHDMKSAEEAYNGFVALVKWGTITTAIVVAIVIAIIAT
ncbi:MAG: aa3-type cytochrome c oxidase subunit IV [Novosphingobium sp.]|nr:aa3-type cytochrome c oxidase subunit IV [Novosphingobium sp.]